MWDLIVSVPDHCLSFYLGPMGLSRDSYRPPPGPVYSRKTDCTGVPKSACQPHGLVTGGRMSTVRNIYEIL